MSGIVLESDGVVFLEAGLHVVGVEDGSGGGRAQTSLTHHADV